MIEIYQELVVGKFLSFCNITVKNDRFEDFVSFKSVFISARTIIPTEMKALTQHI